MTGLGGRDKTGSLDGSPCGGTQGWFGGFPHALLAPGRTLVDPEREEREREKERDREDKRGF